MLWEQSKTKETTLFGKQNLMRQIVFFSYRLLGVSRFLSSTIVSLDESEIPRQLVMSEKETMVSVRTRRMNHIPVIHQLSPTSLQGEADHKRKNGLVNANVTAAQAMEFFRLLMGREFHGIRVVNRWHPLINWKW